MARRRATPPASEALEDDPPQAEDDTRASHEAASKTQRKRQAHDLQDLGEALAALPAARLAAMDLPPELRTALQTLQGLRSHEARRRQSQWVGRLMRSADADALREALAAATLGDARNTLALHQAERWRDELIVDDAAVQRWLHDHPDTDVQHLRSLVRAARRDQPAAPTGPGGQAERQPRSHRELFRFIRPLV